jgi:hypothetical protein
VLAPGGTLAIQSAQLLANDSDPDGDPLSILRVSGAEGAPQRWMRQRAP